MSESGIWKFLIFDGLETILLQRRESSGTVLASKYFFLVGGHDRWTERVRCFLDTYHQVTKATK